MTISYGDLVTCAIDVVGDTDLFTFSGTAGEVIMLQATRQSGGSPCVELFRPNSTRLGSDCALNGARIDATLDQTGPYTILVGAWANNLNGTMGYALALQCVSGPCVAPPPTTGALRSPSAAATPMRSSQAPRSR